MTACVVDASVAVKRLIYEELSDCAVAFARSNNHFIAPRMIMTEVANALARKAIQGAISSEDAKEQFKKLPYFFDEVVSVDDLIIHALLVTADQRLSSKLANSDLAACILLLSNWQSA